MDLTTVTQEAPRGRVIALPQIASASARIRIAGVTPLLINRPSERTIKNIEGDQAGRAKITKPPRDPEQEFQDAIHWMADGQPGFPAAGVKSAMVTAGFRFGDEKGTELRGKFSIPAHLLPIESPGPIKRSDVAMIGGATRIMYPIYRPEYWPWAMWVPIVYRESFISLDQIVNLLMLAGESVGIGSWRVERKGSMGMFVVKAVEGTEL